MQCTFFIFFIVKSRHKHETKERKYDNTVLSQLRDTLGLGVSRGLVAVSLVLYLGKLEVFEVLQEVFLLRDIVGVDHSHRTCRYEYVRILNRIRGRRVQRDSVYRVNLLLLVDGNLKNQVAHSGEEYAFVPGQFNPRVE